jgi:hypothetical protein
MEKELLKNHVREISKIIFGDLLLNTSVLVNEEKTQKFESKFMCEIELINEEINQNQISCIFTNFNALQIKSIIINTSINTLFFKDNTFVS